jgi:ADP-ribose pyrophosphatase
MNILRTRALIRQRHLHLYDTLYRDRKGGERHWIYTSRHNPPKIETGRFHPPDAVVIAARHTRRNELVVIEEFRVPLGGYQYGFPAGLVDEGESVAEAAARELEEETGLRLLRVLAESPPIYSSPGVTDESVSMVFCECDGKPSASGNEASEDIRVRFLDREAAGSLCADRQCKVDAKAWLVLHGYALTGAFGLAPGAGGP